MGIDARIVLRLKQTEQPTEDWLIRTSFAMCSSLGAKNFFIKDGLPPTEFKPVYDTWNKAWKNHPLKPKLDEQRDHALQMDLRKQILADIGEVPEERRLAIDLSRDGEDYEGTGRPITPGKIYHQDADPVIAADGEWLLEVSVWTRYYGVGYERGDLNFLCSVAEWAEVNIPNCEVWYGGDSSGVELTKFDNSARIALRRHLYSAVGRDYFNYMTFGDGKKPPACGLCPRGEPPHWSQYGAGGNYIACHCAGCGKSKESRDNGATWQVVKEER